MIAKNPMRRFVVLHPQATFDAAVLIARGLLWFGSQGVSHALLRFADWFDARLAEETDLGGED